MLHWRSQCLRAVCLLTAILSLTVVPLQAQPPTAPPAPPREPRRLKEADQSPRTLIRMTLQPRITKHLWGHTFSQTGYVGKPLKIADGQLQFLAMFVEGRCSEHVAVLSDFPFFRRLLKNTGVGSERIADEVKSIKLSEIESAEGFSIGDETVISDLTSPQDPLVVQTGSTGIAAAGTLIVQTGGTKNSESQRIYQPLAHSSLQLVDSTVCVSLKSKHQVIRGHSCKSTQSYIGTIIGFDRGRALLIAQSRDLSEQAISPFAMLDEFPFIAFNCRCNQCCSEKLNDEPVWIDLAQIDSVSPLKK